MKSDLIKRYSCQCERRGKKKTPKNTPGQRRRGQREHQQVVLHMVKQSANRRINVHGMGTNNRSCILEGSFPGALRMAAVEVWM